MKISYNWLQDYIKERLPSPEKLAEILTMHSFEVESVEKKGKDFVLDIDVLPNRAPDCLSFLGIAREIAVITNNEFQVPGPKFQEDRKLKAKDFVEAEVKNKEDCSRYTAKVILGVRIKPAPKWIQEKLRVCGLQPINNIVDITNYLMLETGQPIHAFDLDKVGKKIIVRRAKKGEKIAALDDKTYRLDRDILVIADQKRPMAIAGIKGGESTGIDSKTKNIVIEAANFNQRVVRQGSKRLKLRTDASWRFENGLDPNLIDFAQEKVASLIQKMAGGKIAQGLVDFYPKKILPKKINLNLDYLEKLLGIKVPKNNLKNILQKLAFKVTEVLDPSTGRTRARPLQLQVEVPTRRLDVSIQEDLIEEIGRIYGFQNIPSTFPRAALISPKRNEELFWQKNIKDILKGVGFFEVYNYSFISEKDISIYQLSQHKSAVIELENPMSSFNRYLRPSLIPNLLKNIRENLKFFEEIKIFEMGKIFGRREKKMLAGVLTRKNIKDEGFYELKGMVDSLLNKLGISDVWYDDYQPTPEESKLAIWHPQKSAEIKSNGEEIGFLGEILPKVVEDLDLRERVFVFDLDFEKLLKLASEEQVYQPISTYPAAVRDLAILVPQGTKVVEILNKINTGGGKLVRDVDIFDIYRGEGIPQGKENFAFHIIYQAEDRTLSSRELDRIHQRIIRALEENPGWEVRR